MTNENTPNNSCCTPGSSCCAPTISRRDFMTVAGAEAATALLPMASETAQAASSVSHDKNLDAYWLFKLSQRGEVEICEGDALQHIGMPVSGICSGQLYLGGDGRLWLWDVFNDDRFTFGENYAAPLSISLPLDQGFALRVAQPSREYSQVRKLQSGGFSRIAFRGEYPIGTVEYSDANCPVAVSLEAFSPFVPLDVESSSLPATVMRFTLHNTSGENVEIELAGWMENAVGLHTYRGVRRNAVVREAASTRIECRAEKEPETQERAPQLFADFEDDDYGNWKSEGKAFGAAPSRGGAGVQTLSGFAGKGTVNTYATGARFPDGSDEPQGKLISPPFLIERPFLSFLIGGGDHPNETCINLIVDGHIVRTATGQNTDAMAPRNWDVRNLLAKTAHLEIVDARSDAWGHIDIDHIEFRDVPLGSDGALEMQPDFGTMALSLLGKNESDQSWETLPAGARPQAIFAAENAAYFPPENQSEYSQAPQSDTAGGPCGALSRTLALTPHEKTIITFLVTWHFPNLQVPVKGETGRHYATRFDSAGAVARHLEKNLESLSAQTRLWRDTWRDSTLPHWFLERTFANASTLATSTSHWLKNGRFYGWEGVGSCYGTCTHVWHYAHSVARLFPQLERSAREMADYGIGFDEKSGVIGFRGEMEAPNEGYAVDGQAGTILRAFREHQMSSDDAFLKRLWPRIKKSIECLIDSDSNGNGLLEGRQHNTLDAEWYGPVAWLSGLYVAALRAGEAMAREIGDESFARRCEHIAETGSKNIVERLWNGEYFIQLPDAAHPQAVRSGEGCEIDQVFGQSWAWQVNLPRITPREYSQAALRALWKYNFLPDVGAFRKENPSGRWFAMVGEGGLIMCSFPRGGREDAGGIGKGTQNTASYFNECMSGFEYQVAGHMMWEGMTTQSLAICRAIHDRYDAKRRNPWNEIECGDHYARAMASHGVFLAACGYEYHGPRGHLGFAPRLSPDDFRAAFTTAEGWGTFSQQRRASQHSAKIEMKYGRLKLQTLSLELAKVPAEMPRVLASISGNEIALQAKSEETKLTLHFTVPLILQAGDTLEILLN